MANSVRIVIFVATYIATSSVHSRSVVHSQLEAATARKSAVAYTRAATAIPFWLGVLTAIARCYAGSLCHFTRDCTAADWLAAPHRALAAPA